MNEHKLYASAAVFLLLTGLKLLFPLQSLTFRERLLGLINQDTDYMQAVETLGRKISQGGFGEELTAVLGLRTDREAGEEDGLRSAMAEEDGPTPTSVTESPATTAAAPETPAAETPALPAVAEAFIQAQKAFPGVEIPENVRLDMPELPFEYTAPVFGINSSGFGFREHPIDGGVKFHYGTDFAAESGEEVLAFAEGYVYAAGESESYGNYIILTHEGGLSSLYAHLSEFAVSEGDMVSRGQLIGRVGQTGKATGPHLHFELLINDVYINPEYYI